MFGGLIISKPFYFIESRSRCGYCRGKKSREEDYYCLDSWYQEHAEDSNHLDLRVQDQADPSKTPKESLPENCTLGFQAELISVELYDKLCNMGYRRSGKFIYKPDLLRNCCRLYTIRTKPELVTMSKEMKSTLRRFSKRVLPSGKTLQKDAKGGCHYMEEIVETEKLSESFKTCFEPAVFTEEKYRLFAKYQEHVHNDFDHNAKSFKRFLCDSPFSKETVLGTEDEWEQLNGWKELEQNDKLKRLGPVHECYYFEGNLIAMAVTDILPSGLSSVYFIWDPDYHKWSLGKLSALRELSLLNKANLEYYYMGYYLDDCPKMSYKAKYGGELLDVSTHKYLPLVPLAQLKRSGKLFTLEELCNGHSEAMSGGEFALNDALARTVRSIDEGAAVKNVAEEIYGTKSDVYVEANEAARALTDLDIPYTVNEPPFRRHSEEEDVNETHDIPNVIPGLVPLTEVLQMVKSDKISGLRGTVSFFDMLRGGIRRLDSFEDESPEIKRALCDVIRLIGLENTRNMLLIV